MTYRKHSERNNMLVVLTFIKCRKERVEYVVNSVLGQNVNCDILLIGNRNSGLDFEKLFEIINYVEDRNIRIYFPTNN